MTIYQDLSDHPFEQFRRAESAALALDDWDRWIARAERLFGASLDGDEDTDGFSLDAAYDAFKAGLSPRQYIDEISQSAS